MKQSQTCPKCQSQEIVHIPGKSQKAGYDVGENIHTGRTNAHLAMVDIHVCSNCGYVEYWVASPQDLEKVQKKFG